MRGVLQLHIPSGRQFSYRGEGRKWLGAMVQSLGWGDATIRALFAVAEIGEDSAGVVRIAILGEEGQEWVMQQWDDFSRIPRISFRFLPTGVSTDGRLHRYRVSGMSWQAGSSDRGRWDHLFPVLRQGLIGEAIPPELRAKVESEITRGLMRTRVMLDLDYPDDAPSEELCVRLERVKSRPPMRLGESRWTSLLDLEYTSPLRLWGYWSTGRLKARGCGRVYPIF